VEEDEKQERHEKNTEEEWRKDQGFSDCASAEAKMIMRPLPVRNMRKAVRWRTRGSRFKQTVIWTWIWHWRISLHCQVRIHRTKPRVQLVVLMRHWIDQLHLLRWSILFILFGIHSWWDWLENLV